MRKKLLSTLFLQMKLFSFAGGPQPLASLRKPFAPIVERTAKLISTTPEFDVLAKHYGLTDEEMDFIINYDIKYRMGRESKEE